MAQILASTWLKYSLTFTFLAGDNNVAVSDTEDVSVAAISDALFGTWSGVITYEASIVDAE